MAQKALGIMKEDTACQYVSLWGADIMELSDSWTVGLALPFAIGVGLVQSFVPFPGTLRIPSCVRIPDPSFKWCLRALPSLVGTRTACLAPWLREISGGEISTPSGLSQAAGRTRQDEKHVHALVYERGSKYKGCSGDPKPSMPVPWR